MITYRIKFVNSGVLSLRYSGASDVRVVVKQKYSPFKRDLDRCGKSLGLLEKNNCLRRIEDVKKVITDWILEEAYLEAFFRQNVVLNCISHCAIDIALLTILAYYDNMNDNSVY